MHDIICPHCNKAFKVDETGYADILKQVRDADFHAQLHERLELAEQDKRNAIALAQAQVANELQKSTAAKDSEIQGLKAELDAAEKVDTFDPSAPRRLLRITETAADEGPHDTKGTET